MRIEKILMGIVVMILLATAATAAVSDLTVTSPNGGEVWSGTHTITWNADNGNSNLKIKIQKSFDGMNWDNIASGEANDGSFSWDTTQAQDYIAYLIKVSAIDMNTDMEVAFDVSDNAFTVDNNAPTTGISWQGKNYVNPQEKLFVASTTTFTLTAQDMVSGVAATYYQLNDGPVVTYNGPFTLNGVDGAYTIHYWSVDNAGNEEQHNQLKVVLDSTGGLVTVTADAPNGENGWYVPQEDPMMTSNVHLSCADAGVGAVSLFYKWDFADTYTNVGGLTADLPITIKGAHRLYFYCTDKFANSNVDSVDFNYNDVPFMVGAAPLTSPNAPKLTLLFLEAPAGMYTLDAQEAPGTNLDTSGFMVGGDVFTITSGLTNGDFKVKLTFSYNDADNDGIVDGTNLNENDLKVYYRDGEAWVLASNESDPSVDTVANTISTTVNHFTVFTLMGLNSNAVAPASTSHSGGGGGGGSSVKKPSTSTSTTPAGEGQATSPTVQEANTALQGATDAASAGQDTGASGITGAAVAGPSGSLSKTGKVVAVVFAVLVVVALALVVRSKSNKRKR